MFAPLDGRATASLRLMFAAAIPFVFYARAGRALVGGPVDVYLRTFSAHWFWATVFALCAVLAVGLASRAVAALLFIILAPSALLTGGDLSRQVMLCVLGVFVLVRSDAVQWPLRHGDDGPTAGPAWPVRLIQLQLTLLYGANAIAKTTPDYLSGDVLERMSVTRPNFNVDLSSGGLDVGPLVVPVVILAVATVGMEYFLAVGFWFGRLKYVAAAAGVLFHLALTRVVDIHRLNAAAVFLYLAFLLPLVGRPSAARAE